MDDEGFELPVMYNGNELKFPAKLIRFGYSYKIAVEIDGTTVAFEPDEERNWRVLADPELLYGNDKVNRTLMEAIAASLDEVLK